MANNKPSLNADGFIPGQDISFNDLMTHYTRHSLRESSLREGKRGENLSRKKLSRKNPLIKQK